MISQQQKLKQDNAYLLDQNAKLESDNEQLKKLIANWETKYSTLKTANAMLGSNDYKRETKLKINTMMREIDACIAQLAD